MYVFPTTATFLARATVTPVAEDAEWSRVDAVVYFWVRASEVASGMEARLLGSLRPWFTEEWELACTVFVTSEGFRRQRGVLEDAGLQVRFALREPGKHGASLAYG